MAWNTDPLGIKLGNMISNHIKKCEAEFEKAIKIIADNVANSISTENYERSDEFDEALENCEDCAKTCDAADNLCKYIFFNENCKSLKKRVSITTIKSSRWNHNYKEFRNKIEDIFCSEDLDTKKGFVYVFWSASPVKYFYVGKANSKKRFRLTESRHYNAVQSSKEAAKLTIIFPSPNKDTIIKDVEASIIRIIGIDNLIHNENEVSFTEGRSTLSERLSRLKKFLGL